MEQDSVQRDPAAASKTSGASERQGKSNSKRRRFKIRWLLLLVLLVVLGPYLYFRATSFSRKIQTSELQTTAPARQFSGTLRVATWNIAHGRGAISDNWAAGGDSKQRRLESISQQIVELDADLVVLNEVDFCATWSGGYYQAETIARKTGYPYMVKQANLDFGFVYGRWFFGNVLLSRFPISETKVVEFAPVNQWESWLVGNKRGLSCTVELDPEVHVSVIGLHLESRGETVRVREVADVARFGEQLAYPMIIAGDLNTTPRGAPRAKVSDDGRNAFDEFIKATGLSHFPALPASPSELTFPSLEPATTIDWILYDEAAFSLNQQRVIETELSDHLPVVAEFQIRSK